MTKSVEFCFDFVSPAAYIAWHVLPRIAERAGVEITYRPVFLGGVMQATGNRPPGMVEAKARWMERDLARWAELYGLDYRKNDIHPQRTLTAMRGARVLLGDRMFRPYGDALFRAMHVENLEVQDPQIFAQLIAGLSLDPEEFLTRLSVPENKDGLKADTERAVIQGMFGAPTFFVGDRLHFGQDRLWMVAEDLGTTIHDAVA